MKEIQILVFVVLTVPYVVGRPAVQYFIGDSEVQSAPAESINQYLSNYGYNGYYTEVKGKTSMDSAIRKLQYFAGIPVTGKWDSDTQELMMIPRCGRKDPYVSSNDTLIRKRRFNKQGTLWEKDTLTWRYEHNPDRNQVKEYNLKRDDVRNVFITAMKEWMKYTNIEFIEELDDSKEVDIVIKFEARSHGDPFPFDGWGGTLAHAFFPLNNKGFSGDVHFDDDERYSIGTGESGTKDLLWVATHELGHSLGLDHSREKVAIMYPWYTGYRKKVELYYDDIRGIQEIYGSKVVKKVEKVKCPSSDMTAMWYSPSSQSYMFIGKDQKAYRASVEGVIQAGPIESEFKDKVTSVDSVFQSTEVKDDNKEYNIIFAEDEYYIYKENSYIAGPHSISVGYSDEGNCGFPANKIDAVMKWWRNKKVYFFSGEDYWRFDEDTNKIDCQNYPRKIAAHFIGLPAKIDAAYSSASQEKTYFIAGDDIYLFNDKLVSVASGYPQKLRNEMFKECE